MSRTDKTRPYRVIIFQEPQITKTLHRHDLGPCDLDTYDPLKMEDRTQNCFRTFRGKYTYTLKYYDSPGVSSWFRGLVKNSNGAARAKLRMSVREMLKMEIEDIEDFDVEPVRHRHSALSYYW